MDASESKSNLVPRNRYLALLAGTLLVIGVLEATHVVELPLASILSGSGGSLLSLNSLYNFMGAWGYLSLFVLMALESASVPIPSEFVLPVAGYFISIGALGSFPLALAVSTVAALVGALVDYYLADYLGRPFVTALLTALRIDPSSLNRAENWFRRSGQWTVFAARFVPLLRTLISLPAGLFRMGLRNFVLMTLLGCLVWNAVLLYLGYAAGKLLTNYFTGPSSATGVDILSGFVAIVCALYLAYFFAGRNRTAVRTQTEGGRMTRPVSE